MPPIIAAGKFQFHKGTIKTLQECACRSSDYNFNSIKVQLRQEISTRCQRLRVISIP